MFILEAFCSVCNSPMEHTGVVFYSDPLQYEMKCTDKHCCHFERSKELYPQYAYEPVED